MQSELSIYSGFYTNMMQSRLTEKRIDKEKKILYIISSI